MSPSETFEDLELVGWQARAKAYDDHLGRITAGIAAEVVDGLSVGEGESLLDLACGPGYAAVHAMKRGARVLGVDFSSEMVAEAGRRFPGVNFAEGDAQNLALADESFDVVVCLFGVAHFPDADAALAECHRMLCPGGRLAFTAWSRPEENDFFRVLLDVIDVHGRSDVPLPPAPDMYRFVDRSECKGTLSDRGFQDIAVRSRAYPWRTETPDMLLEILEKSTVRAAMMVERQKPNSREKIRSAIVERAEQFRVAGGFETNWGYTLVTARKP